MDLDYFLMHQLNNKFINQPVLIDRLIIANISNHNPQDFFPGDWYGTKECYVLTPRSNYLYGLVFRPDRRAGNGYWKGTTPGNVIFGMDGLVGVKKNLCFYEGDQSQSHGLQTNWKMIEYRLQQHICSFTCDHKSGREKQKLRMRIDIMYGGYAKTDISGYLKGGAYPNIKKYLINYGHKELNITSTTGFSVKSMKTLDQKLYFHRWKE